MQSRLLRDVYYAMFDAARAALMAYQDSDEVLSLKTHSGLISNFSLQLVKPGMIDMEMGKALNKVEDLRLIADYKGDAITLDAAGWAVEQAEMFFAAVHSRFFADKT